MFTLNVRGRQEWHVQHRQYVLREPHQERLAGCDAPYRLQHDTLVGAHQQDVAALTVLRERDDLHPARRIHEAVDAVQTTLRIGDFDLLSSKYTFL